MRRSHQATFAAVLMLSGAVLSCSPGMRQQSAMSESETRALLQQRGYSQVGEISPAGSAYETTAVRNGSPVRVRVNPDNQAISAIPLNEDALNDSE